MARIQYTQAQIDEINARHMDDQVNALSKKRRKFDQEKIKKQTRKASEPNKTELRFKNEILLGWGSLGLIEGCRFHAIALIWPEYRYTPDWLVWNKDGQITLIEVKGAYIHSDDSRIRFLTARREYPWFRFECWQWKDKQWREIWK